MLVLVSSTYILGLYLIFHKEISTGAFFTILPVFIFSALYFFSSPLQFFEVETDFVMLYWIPPPQTKKKKDVHETAAGALWNLAFNPGNALRIVEEGGVPALVHLCSSSGSKMARFMAALALAYMFDGRYFV